MARNTSAAGLQSKIVELEAELESARAEAHTFGSVFAAKERDQGRRLEALQDEVRKAPAGGCAMALACSSQASMGFGASHLTIKKCIWPACSCRDPFTGPAPEGKGCRARAAAQGAQCRSERGQGAGACIMSA